MRTQRHPSVSLKIPFPPSPNGVHADSNRTNFKADLDESFQSGIVKQCRFSIFTALSLILLRKKGIIHFRRVILFKEICFFFLCIAFKIFYFLNIYASKRGRDSFRVSKTLLSFYVFYSKGKSLAELCTQFFLIFLNFS